MLTSQVSGARVYLVGTAHFSRESCDDVSLVIQAVQPDIVMVELCKQVSCGDCQTVCVFHTYKNKDYFGSVSRSQIILAPPAPAPKHYILYRQGAT